MSQDPQTAYEAEQEKLRTGQEGLEEGELMPLPKEPEVDPRVYRDVEPLLFRGFLVLPATLGSDIRLVLKSLNHHEYERLHLAHGGRSQDFYLDFLSYSTFMVKGKVVLSEERREAIRDLYASLPEPLKQRILSALAEVNRKASDAVRLVEAYSMETLSRLRWAQYKGVDLTSSAVTGIPGTGELGYNWGQLLWRALNYFQDTREETDRHWEHAKFIGGCFAGKGINKVHNQDRRRRREEIEHRIARKDQILREVVLLEKDAELKIVRDGAVVKAAASVEDLASQLENDLKGEEDFHDRVVRAVEDYHAKVREDREAELRRLYEEAEKKADGQRLIGTTDRTGMTEEEMKQRVARTHAVMNQTVAQRIVRPAPPEENPYERYRPEVRPLPPSRRE